MRSPLPLASIIRRESVARRVVVQGFLRLSHMISKAITATIAHHKHGGLLEGHRQGAVPATTVIGATASKDVNLGNRAAVTPAISSSWGELWPVCALVRLLPRRYPEAFFDCGKSS